MVVKFKIEDMHCGHCTAAVEKAVSQFEGINSVKTDLSDKTCIVDFDENSVSVKKIQGAIDEIGFEAVEV